MTPIGLLVIKVILIFGIFALWVLTAFAATAMTLASESMATKRQEVFAGWGLVGSILLTLVLASLVAVAI